MALKHIKTEFIQELEDYPYLHVLCAFIAQDGSRESINQAIDALSKETNVGLMYNTLNNIAELRLNEIGIEEKRNSSILLEILEDGQTKFLREQHDFIVDGVTITLKDDFVIMINLEVFKVVPFSEECLAEMKEFAIQIEMPNTEATLRNYYRALNRSRAVHSALSSMGRGDVEAAAMELDNVCTLIAKELADIALNTEEHQKRIAELKEQFDDNGVRKDGPYKRKFKEKYYQLWCRNIMEDYLKYVRDGQKQGKPVEFMQTFHTFIKSRRTYWLKNLERLEQPEIDLYSSPFHSRTLHFFSHLNSGFEEVFVLSDRLKRAIASIM